MTPSQITAIQTSFAKVFPQKTVLSETFYAHLFQIAPVARDLFPEDMALQRQKLVDMLAYVVRHLHETDKLVAQVLALGRRHAGYGATVAHLPPVGASLIHALEVHSPGGLSDTDRDAWTAAFTMLSDVMAQELPAA